jgi:hypothetical protein
MSDEHPWSHPGEPSNRGESHRPNLPSPPPRPDLATQSAPSRRRRRWPWIVAVLLLANAGVVALLFTRYAAPDVPEQIAGLPRLRTDQAKAFEDLLSSYGAGGLSLRGGMYGIGDRPELILERFVGSDDPFQGIPIETVLGQAGSAFGQGLGGSGEIDTGATMSQTRGGARYACAPYHGAVPGVGDLSIICIFAGQTSGILVDLRTSETTSALDDAEAAYRAVLDSS